MPSVKQLLEDRAPIGNEIRRMADTLTGAKTDFTAEERSKWDKLNEDFNRLTSQIEATRSAKNVDDEFSRRAASTPGLEDTVPRSSKAGRKYREDVADEFRALALQAWCRRQHGFELSDEQRRACKVTGLNPNRSVIELRLAKRPNAVKGEKRAMSAIQPSAGGYMIAESFSGSFEKALKDFNGPRQVADVMRTTDGAMIPWPTTDDTNNEGELIGENTAVAEQDVSLGVTNFGAYKYSSKMVKLPNELAEDSAFEMNTFLGDLLGERIGRAQNRHFTNGTGASQPSGVAAGSVLGKTAASATAIAADEIIDLIHSIDPAYRRDPSFRLMMHDLILAVIRKMKDGQGRYLFEEGNNGAPDRVKGVPIVINQNMDSTLASGKKPIIAGAFKKFKIRDVNRLRLKKLEERYAELDQLAFIAFMRSDSKILNAGTGPIKHLLLP